MSDKKKGLELLREPFPANQISKMCRSTKKDNAKGHCSKCGGWHGIPAIQLDYVGHAALTDRLLDADPLWTWEPMAIGVNGYPAIDQDGGMWLKLTVCGVTRFGYGDAQGKLGGDAMKERIGDALRNAAMRFGAALDLWHKGDLHVEDEAVTGDSSKGKTLAEDVPMFYQKDGHPEPAIISEPQRKRLYAISKTNQWDDEGVKMLLAEYGFASSKDITADKYNEICEKLTAS